MADILASHVTGGEDKALLRLGQEKAGTVTIRRQSGSEPDERDLVVAVVYGQEFARELVERWNAPLLEPRSWSEYVSQFAART